MRIPPLRSMIIVPRYSGSRAGALTLLKGYNLQQAADEDFLSPVGSADVGPEFNASK